MLLAHALEHPQTGAHIHEHEENNQCVINLVLSHTHTKSLLHTFRWELNGGKSVQWKLVCVKCVNVCTVHIRVCVCETCVCKVTFLAGCVVLISSLWLFALPSKPTPRLSATPTHTHTQQLRPSYHKMHHVMYQSLTADLIAAEHCIDFHNPSPQISQ